MMTCRSNLNLWGIKTMRTNRDNHIRYVDDIHKNFYLEQVRKLKPDIYLRSLIYTLGMCHDTRRHFDNIYDAIKRCINPETIFEPWQTGSSLKVTRLAFQLFTDSTPTAYLSDTLNVEECMRYTVSDIFCCNFAPYFVDAINLRYPEYLI
jgi:hypothetical protein